MSSTTTPNKRGRKRAHSPDPADVETDAAQLPEVTISPPNKKQKKKPTESKKSTASERNAKAAEEYNKDREAPIYDDCNDVRRKIRAHINKGVKITAFLKEIGGVAHNSYQQFMRMKHPNQGAGNRIYEAAYHYFERRRIAEGKPKSQSRLRAEGLIPEGRDKRSSTGYWYVAGSSSAPKRGGSWKPDPAIRREFLRKLFAEADAQMAAQAAAPASAATASTATSTI